jgi:hypothetical protein
MSNNNSNSDRVFFTITDENVAEPSPEFNQPATVEVPKTVVVKQEWMTREDVLGLISSKGLQILQQSGYFKVEASKGNRVYVPVTKTVRKVFLSGFEVSMSLAEMPKNGAFGSVKQQMKVEGTKVQQLERLGQILDILIAQDPKTVKPSMKAKKVENVEKTDVTTTVKVDDNAEKAAVRAARLELIKKVAAEKGVGISTKTINELENVG